MLLVSTAGVDVSLNKHSFYKKNKQTFFKPGVFLWKKRVSTSKMILCMPSSRDWLVENENDLKSKYRNKKKKTIKKSFF